MVKIEQKIINLSKIKPNPDNPRRISTKDMDRLVKSLQDFPEMMKLREIVVDETMTVLGGNMRLLALRKIGAVNVTAKIVKGLTEDQKREFIIKDNAAFGEWDFDLLSAWDDLPLVDFGVKIPENWTKPQGDEPGDMRKNFAGNYGADKDTEDDQAPAGEKFPLTLILSREEHEKWQAVKNRLKIQGDKTAFLQLIGG